MRDKSNTSLLTNLNNPHLLNSENINLKATYLLSEEAPIVLKNNMKPKNCSLLHLNISIMRNNFETLVISVKFTVSGRTWCQIDT